MSRKKIEQPKEKKTEFSSVIDIIKEAADLKDKRDEILKHGRQRS